MTKEAAVKKLKNCGMTYKGIDQDSKIIFNDYMAGPTKFDSWDKVFKFIDDYYEIRRCTYRYEMA